MLNEAKIDKRKNNRSKDQINLELRNNNILIEMTSEYTDSFSNADFVCLVRECGYKWMGRLSCILYENGKCPECEKQERKKSYIIKTLNGTNFRLVGKYIDSTTPTVHCCINPDCRALITITPKNMHQKIQRNVNKADMCIECNNRKIKMRTRKVCSKCQKDKELSKFYQKSNTKDSLDFICIDCSKQLAIKWRNDNLIQSKTNSKKWYDENQLYIKNKRLKDRSRNNERTRNRLKNDPGFKYMRSLRGTTRRCYKSKVKRTYEQIGCTRDHLRKHLMSTFLPGMTHENHGKVWSIDHIIPIKWCFDNMSKEEFELKCNHWTNLQALFKEDNIKKLDNLPYDFHKRSWVVGYGWKVAN